ncbi:hypothetical protein J1G42_01960 [Cellulomonas sp. zg-ZUI222]|uniref:Uncharacterized protein n=1 Tax=Cellulomonas wangleii TaxID=2816956 RepID=A0ABX8D487_9CELL|nr:MULTISPECIES: hypothetical protein [Cellulomonas]MBO0898725.1 hypothetical protein [Cellulomonas sp. zg-ZUI22]MBO0919587.1 hypothetical protein [Cellulomonas wangleii]MBO0924269.1 hypothetical protein [Cellulomonas wangleii]QVI62280.1 hypothetical protein KG103_18045 [Cellulomonas wangleii]
MPQIDTDALLGAWRGAADTMDEFDVLRGLVESQARLSPEDDTRAARARAALFDGDPVAALDILGDVGEIDLDTASVSWADVVAVGARAAQGDADALGALHRLGQGLQGSVAVAHGYLLARVAELAGEHEVADATWHLLKEIAPGTTLLTRRVLVVDTLARSTTDADAATRRVGATARTLVELVPAPEDGPRHVVEVVRALEERGDPAGARLVLEAIVAMRPTATEVVALRDARATPEQWWRERLPGLVATGVAAVLVTVGILASWPVWVPALAAVVSLVVWKRWRLPHTPGLSATDARVLAYIRGWLPDAAEDIGAGRRRVGLAITGAAVGFVAGALVMGVVTEGLLADLYATHAREVDAVAWALVLLAAFLGGVGAQRLLRRPLATATQQLVERQRAAVEEECSRCTCLRTVGIRGRGADVYLTRHLTGAAKDVAALAPQIPGATVSVHQCPMSRTPWLAVRRPGYETLVLRGVLAHVEEEATPQATTGGYL